MKLIIDIPDHIYSMVTNTGTFGCYRFNTSKAIRQGIPLDKIRAEIADEKIDFDLDIGQEIHYNRAIDDVLAIIDKYREGDQE